jgi:hypothetical protein
MNNTFISFERRFELLWESLMVVHHYRLVHSKTHVGIVTTHVLEVVHLALEESEVVS